MVFYRVVDKKRGTPIKPQNRATFARAHPTLPTVAHSPSVLRVLRYASTRLPHTALPLLVGDLLRLWLSDTARRVNPDCGSERHVRT